MAEQRKLETILLENKLVSREQLKQITSYAHAVGIELYEAVLQKKVAPAETVMMAYAESIGLPFVPLADITFDEELVARIDPISARQYSYIPISIDQGQVLLATTKPVIPDVEEELRMIFSLPVRCVICTPAELSDAITKYYPRGASHIIKADRTKMPASSSAMNKPENAGQMSDEERKKRFQMSFVAFNFSVFFVCFACYSFHFPRVIHNTWYQFPLLALIGIIIGGIAASITWKQLSR